MQKGTRFRFRSLFLGLYPRLVRFSQYSNVTTRQNNSLWDYIGANGFFIASFALRPQLRKSKMETSSTSPCLYLSRSLSFPVFYSRPLGDRNTTPPHVFSKPIGQTACQLHESDYIIGLAVKKKNPASFRTIGLTLEKMGRGKILLEDTTSIKAIVRRAGRWAELYNSVGY